MTSSSQEGSTNKNKQPAQQQQSWQASDLIIGYLEQIGVEYVFGIPGGAIEPLYNALARSERRGSLRSIVARHESGAAFMADGYTRETGKLGVCCATTGPGTTNLITGVASAYQDNIPMLVISAQTPLNTFGKGGFQESSMSEVNTVAMFKYCTRYSALVTHIDQLETILMDALMIAHRHPKGPVHLSIPLDILRSPMQTNQPAFQLNEILNQQMLPDNNTVDLLYKNLCDSRKTVFVIGNGCAESIGSILELSLLLKAFILTTPQGKGLVSSYHPQYKGVFGFAGHHSAHDILKNNSTDLVLAIGTSLSEWESCRWDESCLLNDKLVHIDATSTYFSRTPMAKQHVSCDLSALFECLLNRFYDQNSSEIHSHSNNLKEIPFERMRTRASKVEAERRDHDRRGYPGQQPNKPGTVRLHLVERRIDRIGDRRKKSIIPANPKRHFNLSDESKIHANTVPIKPQRLMYELSRLFPPNTRFFADTGNSFAWATHYLHPINRRVAGNRNSNGGVIRVSMGFSSMGWAIGSAIGTALGNRDNAVVSITGDGSYLMCGQEITVAVAEGLTVIYVILNDHALGMVKHGQQLSGAEQIGYELPQIDFKALAEAVGADAYTIKSPDDLIMLDTEAICQRKGPTLLDVHIDPEEIPPIDVRMDGLRVGH